VQANMGCPVCAQVDISALRFTALVWYKEDFVEWIIIIVDYKY